MNDSNLRSLKDLSKEQRKAIAVKGGKASAKAKQEKAKLKECFNILANLDLNKEEQEQLKRVGISSDNLSNNMLIAFNVMQKAKEGDSKALKVYLEMTDQDIELELKRKDLQLKEYSLNIGEYKASSDALLGNFRDYLDT